MNTARKAIAALALAAVPFAGVMGIATHAAQAEPKGGTTPKSCDMEVDGKTVKVEPGTRVGLFYCGSDGEWHIGWLVDDVQASTPTTKAPKTPVVKAPQARAAQVAKR